MNFEEILAHHLLDHTYFPIFSKWGFTFAVSKLSVTMWIVAAVLGIINTMSAIADGPQVVGERVAAALTGTLLGIFIAYGFVNPLANRIQMNNNTEAQCLRCIKIAVSGFAKGLAPLTAVEIARRSLDSAVQPGARELEAATKSMAPAK